MNWPNKEIYKLLGIFAVVLLLHGRAYDAGFVTDFTGLWEKMQGKGFLDALQSFGFPSLMPLLNVMYLCLYKAFGINPLPWFLFFAGLYAIGLFYFYKLSLLLLEDIEVADAKKIAMVIIGLILVSPYQVEALIWKVGLGHISAVTFFMMALYYAIVYLRKGIKVARLKMGLCQVASLLCFEWALVFPVMVALFAWCYKQKSRGLRLVGSAALIVVIYLLVTKLMIGKAVGHYDVVVDSFGVISEMWSTMIKYFVKHVSFLHFGTYRLKSTMYGLIPNPIVMISAFGLYGFLHYRLWRSRSKKSRLIFTLSLCCVAALLLVSPLYFQQLHLSENDRYSSLFLPFFTLSIVLWIFSLPKALAYLFIVFFFAFSLIFQQKLVSNWKASNAILTGLVDSFPGDVSPNTLMLNLPENHEGTFMLRDFSGDNPFKDHLMIHGMEMPNLELVAQYKVPKGGQRFVAFNKDNSVKLKLADWGSYWMKGGIGVSSYQTDRYSVELKDRSMVLKLIGEPYDRVLYTDGFVWRYLDEE